MNRFSYCNANQKFEEYKNLHSDFVERCCKTHKEGVFSVDADGTPVFYTKGIKIVDRAFKKRSEQ